MTTLTSAYPVAAKAHTCMSCNGRIELGERYYHWRGVDDLWDGIATLKECRECARRYGRPIPDGEKP